MNKKEKVTTNLTDEMKSQFLECCKSENYKPAQKLRILIREYIESAKAGE